MSTTFSPILIKQAVAYNQIKLYGFGYLHAVF